MTWRGLPVSFKSHNGELCYVWSTNAIFKDLVNATVATAQDVIWTPGATRLDPGFFDAKAQREGLNLEEVGGCDKSEIRKRLQ